MLCLEFRAVSDVCTGASESRTYAAPQNNELFLRSSMQHIIHAKPAFDDEPMVLVFSNVQSSTIPCTATVSVGIYGGVHTTSRVGNTP